MTRDLDWGVPVPLPNSEGKVLYVWLDAPIGYISATKAWAEQTGKSWQRYWAEPDARLIHFIGKDNIVFHCLIFPILLKSHGGFVLPENVPANEFLNLEGQKISTSRNHAVWLHEYLQDFPGKRDELRYVLCSIAPETGDSEFTWKDFQTRVNSELVAVLGNLVNRIMVLHHTYFQGKCTRASGCLSAELQASVERMYGELQNHVEAYRFRSGLQSVMELAREGNRHLTQCEPWKTIKTNPEQAQADLEDMLWMLAHLACGLQPFLPDTAQKILHMLNLPAQLAWQDEIQWNAGHALNPTQMLFEKIEDADMEKQREKLNPPAAEQTAGPSLEAALAPISFQDFSRCDIRVATVLSAEPVEGANRLLKLTVDTGIDTRTVVSGIAEHYSPESVVGRKVCLLVNLEPRKLRGVESQGMVLMAQDLEGRLHFVAPPEGVNNGAQVK
jgi:methionyl-tRNA synthetase